MKENENIFSKKYGSNRKQKARNRRYRQGGSTKFYDWNPSDRVVHELYLQGFRPEENFYDQDYVEDNWPWRRMYAPYMFNPGTTILHLASPRWSSTFKLLCITIYIWLKYFPEIFCSISMKYMMWATIGWFTPWITLLLWIITIWVVNDRPTLFFWQFFRKHFQAEWILYLSTYMTLSEQIYDKAVSQFLTWESVKFELYADVYNLEALREEFNDAWQREEGVITFGHHAEELEVWSEIAHNQNFMSDFDAFELEAFRFTSHVSFDSNDISNFKYTAEVLRVSGMKSRFVYEDKGFETIEPSDSCFSSSCPGDEIYKMKDEDLIYYNIRSNYAEVGEANLWTGFDDKWNLSNANKKSFEDSLNLKNEDNQKLKKLRKKWWFLPSLEKQRNWWWLKKNK